MTNAIAGRINRTAGKTTCSASVDWAVSAPDAITVALVVAAMEREGGVNIEMCDGKERFRDCVTWQASGPMLWYNAPTSYGMTTRIVAS